MTQGTLQIRAFLIVRLDNEWQLQWHQYILGGIDNLDHVEKICQDASQWIDQILVH